MTMEAQIPCFDLALVALLWEIKGVQKTTKEIKSYSRKLLIFPKESKKCKFRSRHLPQPRKARVPEFHQNSERGTLMLEAQRRAIETADIDERLRKVEEAQAGGSK